MTNKEQIINEIVSKLADESLINFVDFPSDADANEAVKQVLSDSLRDFVMVYANAIIQ